MNNTTVTNTVRVKDYLNDISSGSESGKTSWSKIGYGSANVTERDIAPFLTTTSYTFPSTATTMLVRSSSASDASGDTGARTATLYYLTTAFAESSTTFTLTGTTAVTVGTDIYRVQNCRIATTGTNNAPLGNITIYSGSTTYGYISAGKTRMRQAVWTVPANKTLFVTQIAFSCADQTAAKYARFMTRANYDNLSGTVLARGLFMPFHEVVLNNTGYTSTLHPPTKLPATTDLKVSVSADSAAVVTCSLRGWTE